MEAGRTTQRLVGALLPRAKLRAHSTIPLDAASYGPSARLNWDALIRDFQPSGYCQIVPLKRGAWEQKMRQSLVSLANAESDIDAVRRVVCSSEGKNRKHLTVCGYLVSHYIKWHATDAIVGRHLTPFIRKC